jgi:alpha-amylase
MILPSINSLPNLCLDQKPTPENATLLQAYEWNVPADNAHWKRLTSALPGLRRVGVTAMWLPPGCKAASPEGNGYDIYDLYDLGEFDQKGTRATKWGPKEDLLELSKLAKDQGVALYWDAVLNHKAGADNTEKCRVVEVDENDRTKECSEAYEIEGWLGFDFPGRGEKYSKQKYHWEHFSGTDYNQANEKKAIYKILGDNKGWSASVGDEQGNADYMMFADVSFPQPQVRATRCVEIASHTNIACQGSSSQVRRILYPKWDYPFQVRSKCCRSITRTPRFRPTSRTGASGSRKKLA